MNIIFESELMENQKHADVMAPDLAFDVLQSQDGDSLFFSIGTDNIFYLTREVSQTSTGWNKLDLSSALSSQHGGATVAAKAFSIAQNAQTLAIDLALVITVGGSDFLYLSLGNANTDASWANGVTWTAIAFDADTAPSPLTINDVLMMNISGAENIFVDVLRPGNNPLKLFDRYYITPGQSPQWNQQNLSIDLAAGSVSSCLGNRTDDPVPGIYTFGTIGNEQELNFTPQYNYFASNPTTPPESAQLTLPAGASAIASALNSSGLSNLFVAATEGLFLFTPDNQQKNAAPVQIMSSPITAGASSLAAATVGNQTAVWGLDPQGNLFYVTCPAGSEANPTAWSTPVPLLTQVEGFAFFLNLNAGNNILFAHIDGQTLVQLTQDPVTTDWLQRSILLPSTNTDDVIDYDSFTTHIQVIDDNNIPAPNVAVAVTATSPVSVYLNDMYYRLSPTVAVNTTTDATGVLTVVQETQSLSAVCYTVTLTGVTPAVVANINPMSKALTTLSSITCNAQTGSTNLGDVQVTNADGTQQPLVSSSVSASDLSSAAQSLVLLSQSASGLPQDGSRHSASLSATANVSSSLGGESKIKAAAGDFFRWAKGIVDKVEYSIEQGAEGLYHFVATIGEDVYDVVLDCVSAVVHAVEFVFNKIGVFFDDLIKWLGFIFNWSDILRTHKVLKNIFNQYLGKCINSLNNYETDIKNAFTSIYNNIDTWAGIPNNIPPDLSNNTMDDTTRSSQPAPGQNSPQSHWGMHHLKSNAANGSTTAQPDSGIMGALEGLLQPFTDAVAQEEEIIEAAIQSLQTEIIDQIHTLNWTQLAKAVVAIVTDTLLETVENILLALIDFFAALTKDVLDLLNATLDIPVISWLYKKISGDDLSLLDLYCLLSAIPATIIYKLVVEETPFPDNATTTALINAPDFASIQQICNPSQTLAVAAPHTTMPGATQTPSPKPGAVSNSLNNTLGLIGNMAAGVGALALTYFAPVKQMNSSNKFYAVMASLGYLPYVAPDIMGEIQLTQQVTQTKKWWAPVNIGITGLMVLKVSLVDLILGLVQISQGEGTLPGIQKYNATWGPLVDTAANIAWQVPTMFAYFADSSAKGTTLGKVSMSGGTFFDANGWLSYPLAKAYGTGEKPASPEIWLGLAIAAGACNLAYAGLSFAEVVLMYDAAQSGQSS